jgi:hypothetical protein
MKQQTVAQLLKYDFSKDSLFLYDSNGKEIYYEHSDGYWIKRDYDSNGNQIYYENSKGTWYKYNYDSNGNLINFESSKRYWYKKEYDTNDNCIYYENSDGYIVDKRPKKETCNGRVIEIDGKKYKLTEV